MKPLREFVTNICLENLQPVLPVLQMDFFKIKFMIGLSDLKDTLSNPYVGRFSAMLFPIDSETDLILLC